MMMGGFGPMMGGGGFMPFMGGGGFGPMMGGKNQKAGPYGFGCKGGCKGGFKGKGKPKGKPKEEKPMVNPNQINPTKEPFDGGISFKNIFQEKLSKQIHRPMGPGDLVYTCTKVKGGRMCTLTLPCLGDDQPPFESDVPGKDEKVAGQMAAAKALEAMFPDVYVAVLEAHAGAAAGDSEGAGAAVDPNGEPKGLLNRQVQLAAGRPMAQGDIVYETKWRYDINGYHTIVKLNALDGGEGLAVYESDLDGKFTDPKQSEKSAARQALEFNAETFEACTAAHDEKKALEAQKNQFKGGKSFGKGFGKGFGKPCGKGGGK